VNPLLPTSIVDGKGVTTVLAYDARGQVRSIVEALGTPLERTTTMERTGPFPALVTRIESESSAGVPGAIREWSALYDPEGNPTEIVLSGIEAGQAFTEQARASFSATGLPTSIDPPGHASDDVTTWTYDPTRGNLLPLTRTDPLVGTTSYGYDAFNRLVSVIDPNGVETTLAYDVVHRPTEIRRKGASAGDDLVTTVEYDSLGDLLRVHQPEGNVVEYGYDGAGRVDTIERKPDATTPGERISIGYDAAGQPTSVLAQRYLDGGWQTDASTVYLRSSRCQLDGVRHADGRTTEFAYDCSQNLERVWDANHPRADFPNQPTATYGYDALHRLISASEPWAGGGSATTSFAYDLRDHLIRVVDAEGHTTSYTWSDRDLLTEEVSEYSGATTHRYDEAGDRIETLDARSVPRRFVHDALGRTTEVDLPGTSEDTHFLYDLAGVPFARGRLGSVRRGSTAVDYRFDRFGRLTREGALAYDYDRNARRTEISYPNGVRAEYGFDFANRPRSLTLREPGRGATAIVANAEYRAGGPLERLVFGNGVVESRGFDLRALPTAIGAERGGATLLDWSYTTDGLGNVLSIVDRVDASKSRLYGYQEFAYFLNRADGPWGTRAWEYSRIGDRLAETRGTERTLFRETVVEIGGQDRRQRSIEPAAGAKTQFWFDAAGNQTHEVTGNRKLLYDYGNDNRLARIVLEDPSEVGSRASFAYDGRGYLASAQLELPSGRGWSEPTEARRLVATYGGATLFHRETHAYPTVLSIRPVTTTDRDDYLLYFAGRPVGIVTHETITPWRGTPTSSRRLLYLTTDHLGTPVLATSESGAAVWSGGFEPFGADFAGASAAGVFLRFPGQWVDDTFAGSGLTYNLNRWYDSRTGRYTQADPIGISGGINVNSYAGSDPVGLSDPLGLELSPEEQAYRDYLAWTIQEHQLMLERCGAQGCLNLPVSPQTLHDVAKGYQAYYKEVGESSRWLIPALAPELLPLPGGKGARAFARTGPRCPNAGGRLGDARTRAVTQREINSFLSRGYSDLDVEVRFKPGTFGSGKNRYADIVGRNPTTGATEIVQIGKTLKSDPNVPVIRERRALDDIIMSPDFPPGSNVRFVDKNGNPVSPP
jgi:RHS repeat-associated protein